MRIPHERWGGINNFDIGCTWAWSRIFKIAKHVMSLRDIKWSLTIFKCSQNLAFARFASKNWTGTRLLVLAKFSRLLACSDSRLLEIS